MRRWVYKAIAIVGTLLVVFVVILGNLGVAVLTEFGVLPDVVWLAAGLLDLFMAGVLVVMWKY